MRKFALVLMAIPMLSGCVSAAAGLAAMPYKVVEKTVDLTTTSQREKDENLGRAIREHDAQERYREGY